MSDKLKCFCGREIGDLKTLIYHNQLKHQLENNEYQCVLSECKKKTIKGCQNVERHYNTNHNYDQRFYFLKNYAGPVNQIATAGNVQLKALNSN